MKGKVGVLCKGWGWNTARGEDKKMLIREGRRETAGGAASGGVKSGENCKLWSEEKTTGGIVGMEWDCERRSEGVM